MWVLVKKILFNDFYNTFTTNIIWQVVIGGQKSTFNYKFSNKLRKLGPFVVVLQLNNIV